MKNSIFFVLFSAIASGQPGFIKIKFIGNCGLHITDGNSNLYVDFPYKSGAHRYMKYNSSVLDSIKDDAVFLFTHRHSDHYSKKLLKKSRGKKYGNWNADKLPEVTSLIPGLVVEAIKTPHKFTFSHYSYLISWHGKRLFFSGDTGDLKAIGNLKDFDWAFLNPWIYMSAKSENVLIGTKMTALYHLYPQQKITGTIPDNLRILMKQYQVITIPY